MDSDTQIINTVTDFFKGQGFAVERIKEREIKTPDLRVQDKSGVLYLVEVKTKIDDHEFLRSRNEILSTGSVFSENKAIQLSNTLSGNLGNAVGQLSSVEEKAFRLVFYICMGSSSFADKERIVNTLYGREHVMGLRRSDADRTKPGIPYMLPCYYLRESTFYTHRDVLDAAVVVWSTGLDQVAQLCLNDYSSNYNHFKSSQIVSYFAAGTLDPLIEEAENKAFSFRESFDRKDEKHVIMKLCEKYDVLTLNIVPMQMFKATVRIDHSTSDDVDQEFPAGEDPMIDPDSDV